MEKFLSVFSTHLLPAKSYVNPTEEQKAKSLDALKLMFDFYKKLASEELSALETLPGCRPVDTGPLAELYTEGLDEDQIWEQIELVNKPVIKALSGVVTKLSARIDSGEFQLLAQHGNQAEAGPNSSPQGKSGIGNDRELLCEGEEAQDSSEEDLGTDLEEDLEDEEGGPGGKAKAARGRSSVVDDRFFKLAEMEKFLEMAEREEEEGVRGVRGETAAACYGRG